MVSSVQLDLRSLASPAPALEWPGLCQLFLVDLCARKVYELGARTSSGVGPHKGRVMRAHPRGTTNDVVHYVMQYAMQREKNRETGRERD